jgi:acylglycerol lipase
MMAAGRGRGLLLAWALLAIAGMVAACTPQVQTRAPAIQPPAMAADRVVTSDGAQLPLRRWLPDEAPIAIVIAVHGFTRVRGG